MRLTPQATFRCLPISSRSWARLLGLTLGNRQVEQAGQLWALGFLGQPTLLIVSLTV